MLHWLLQLMLPAGRGAAGRPCTTPPSPPSSTGWQHMSEHMAQGMGGRTVGLVCSPVKAGSRGCGARLVSVHLPGPEGSLISGRQGHSFVWGLLGGHLGGYQAGNQAARLGRRLGRRLRRRLGSGCQAGCSQGLSFSCACPACLECPAWPAAAAASALGRLQGLRGGAAALATRQLAAAGRALALHHAGVS